MPCWHLPLYINLRQHHLSTGCCERNCNYNRSESYLTRTSVFYEFTSAHFFIKNCMFTKIFFEKVNRKYKYIFKCAMASLYYLTSNYAIDCTILQYMYLYP